MNNKDVVKVTLTLWCHFWYEIHVLFDFTLPSSFPFPGALCFTNFRTVALLPFKYCYILPLWGLPASQATIWKVMNRLHSSKHPYNLEYATHTNKVTKLVCCPPRTSCSHNFSTLKLTLLLYLWTMVESMSKASSSPWIVSYYQEKRDPENFQISRNSGIILAY